MAIYWKSFRTLLFRLLNRPLWLLLVVSLCLMSLVYLNSTITDLPVGVVDQDHSSSSRQLIRQLNTSSKIETIIYDSIPEAMDDINGRKLFAVIMIPRDFEKRLLHSETVTIPAYGDASNRLANGQIQQDIMLAYREMLTEYNHQTLRANGFAASQIDVILSPIKSETVALFNPGTSFAAITFPGLLVMLLQHSLLMASTRVNITLNTLPQGKPPKVVYLGSLSALVPIWLFLSIVLFILWPWVLGYRQVASIPEILLLTFPFLIAVIGVSKLLTECLRRVEMIYLTLSFLTTPVFYLSGTIWPLDAMPGWVQFVSKLLPSTWATNMIAGVNQMGLSISSVGINIVMLLVLGCVYAGIGIFISMLRSGQIRQYFYIFKKLKSKKLHTEVSES
ncbi:ABC transporter permease [Zophobihabitans entericus]|uniref:ABC transporter permease n=1 Tax=Zophobihabitans entericus TaxID=1635327 RepID=A0A6G9IDS5_9GAMM|nr:ABC transporter permease [Zophobihabitans entericus]